MQIEALTLLVFLYNTGVLRVSDEIFQPRAV